RLRKIVVMETKGLRSFAAEARRLIATFDEVEQMGAVAGNPALIDEALARQTLDDVGLMIYTSGSTGKPKGAMISYRNIRGVVPGIVERLRLTQETSHLSYLPLCHVAEQMLTTFVPLYTGSQVNFGESIRTVQEDLREVAPTMFLGVPLVEVYGLTESTGMVTGHPIDEVIVGTVGTPIHGVEWRIGEAGEFQIRGDMVFAGYYKNPEATATSIRDGWLHTGDVVREEGGQLKIVDRLKDIMITAGGKNLTPSEIENTMKGSPYIKECVIVAEGRKFVGALVMIDFETVGKWAEAQRIPFTHFRSLVEHPKVRELIEADIAQGNQRLAQVSQIRKFHLLTKELDHDDGEVTATMKVRRSSIYKT
ncbi:MAG: AMP-binding protein, partial [Rhodoferax sp.]|nr:AMP-binding protein [Rhodoferax sp.]